MKIRKGDEVVVIRGDDKGKTGRVLSVDLEKNLVVVQRVRLVKRHRKPRSQNVRQGEVEKEMPIAASAVALVDPKSKKPTRVKAQKGDTSSGDRAAARRTKTRISTRSGAEIERPAVKSRG
jgi:large subunit ribosomal protein L24